MKYLKVAALCAVLTSCATPQFYDVDRQQLIQADYDSAWESVMEFFSTNNIMIRTIEKDSGVVYAEREYIQNADSIEALADCGEHFPMAPGTAKVTFNLFVRPVNDTSTSVTVNTDFRRNFWWYSVVTEMPCNSKGVLEQQILEYVANSTYMPSLQ